MLCNMAGLLLCLNEGLIIHLRAVASRRTSRRLLLRDLADHGFGGQHQGADRSSMLQSGAGHLSGIDDARLYQIFVHAGSSVEAVVGISRWSEPSQCTIAPS